MRNQINFIHILLFSILFQGCGQGFESHETASTSASEAGGEINPPTPAPTPSPTPAPPPAPTPDPTPVVDLPAAVELSNYLPRIPDEKCQPKTAIIDPFIGLAMNTKTVCPSGCTYTSIGAAVANAKPNDEITVEAGEYKECLKLYASPLILRGVNGLVTLDARACGTGIVVESLHVKISNFRVFGAHSDTNITSGIKLGSKVKFAQLQGVWLEGMSQGIGGTGDQMTLIVKDFKIKDVGYVYGNNHATGLIWSHAEKLIISRGVFSHRRQKAWDVRSDSPHLEYLCNVSVRSFDESALIIHFNFNKYIRISNNFIQNNPSGRTWFYALYNHASGLTVDFESNFLVSDHAKAFYFNFPSTTIVNAKNNIFVGGDKMLFYLSRAIDLSVNQYFPSRLAAEVVAFPEVPRNFPVDKF